MNQNPSDLASVVEGVIKEVDYVPSWDRCPACGQPQKVKGECNALYHMLKPYA